MEPTDKEDDETAAEPNKKIDRKLLSPGYSHVLALNSTDVANEKIWNVKGQEIDEEEPTFAAAADGQDINLFHLLLVALDS